MRIILMAATLVFVMTTDTAAQTSRYSSWSNPNNGGSGDTLETFIEKLNGMIDEAEKAKAADPIFLQDLRDLAAGATRPWNTTILDDGFVDGDFVRNPTWQVLSGEYFVETGWGLRNKLVQQQVVTQEPINSGEDLAKALLGSVLQQATGAKSAPAPSAPVENVIISSVPVSNAFALSAEISSWVPDGQLAVGVFQGSKATIGYRLVYRSGQALQLVRIGSRGSSIVATSQASLNLEDKEFHTIEWTRDGNGQMRVSVGGIEVLSVADRGFSDPFDGVRLSNSSGDFIVRRITVVGM